MTILLHFLMAMVVLSCILLVGIILLQRTRGGGMGMAFGAGMGEALFGAQAGNILTRITVVLATIFLGCTMLIAVIYAKMGSRAMRERALPRASAQSGQQAPVQRPAQPVPAAQPGPEAQPAGAPATVPSVPEQPSQEPRVEQPLPGQAGGGEGAPPK